MMAGLGKALTTAFSFDGIYGKPCGSDWSADILLFILLMGLVGHKNSDVISDREGYSIYVVLRQTANIELECRDHNYTLSTTYRAFKFSSPALQSSKFRTCGFAFHSKS